MNTCETPLLPPPPPPKALGGGGGGSSGVSQVFNAINANVIKGPVGNALVFLDYDKDGILDSNEPSTRTNNDGGFSLTPTQSNYNIVALTDAKSLDYSSGTNISGQKCLFQRNNLET